MLNTLTSTQAESLLSAIQKSPVFINLGNIANETASSCDAECREAINQMRVMMTIKEDPKVFQMYSDMLFGSNEIVAE